MAIIKVVCFLTSKKYFYFDRFDGTCLHQWSLSCFVSLLTKVNEVIFSSPPRWTVEVNFHDFIELENSAKHEYLSLVHFYFDQFDGTCLHQWSLSCFAYLLTKSKWSVRLFCDDFAFAFAFGWSMVLFLDQPSTKNVWRVFASVFLSIKIYFVTIFSTISFQFLAISIRQTWVKIRSSRS